MRRPIGGNAHPDIESGFPKVHRDKLRVAVQIPALSPGWQGSFRDLAAAAEGDGTADALPLGARSAWPAFRHLRVAEVDKLDLAIEDGKITAFRAKLKVSFKYEGE